MEHRVLPPGERGGPRCPFCNRRVSKDTRDILSRLLPAMCSCGERFSLDEANIPVLRRCADLLTDTSKIFTRRWYHGTSLDDWHTGVLLAPFTPLVHIGTRYAALERGKSLSRLFLYTIKVDAGATVHPEIFPDYNDLDGDVDTDRYDGYSVVRYINRWESPGSISLLINPGVITVLDKTALVW